MAGDRESVDRSFYLQKSRLYETRLKFYMIGRDKSRTIWRVLKIDRAEPSELNICEDPTNYTESECYDLLKRIHEGNRSSGGLRFVTNCYGIAGFVKFLGPYYMLLITKRRKIGIICGHNVYAVSKSKMIALPHSTMRPNMAYSKDENRYKKLLCTVDLTKDFFFSYSYDIMCSLQRNLCDGETGHVLYETMFVWNEYLTRGIRNHLKSTMWTVALVYGFFKQAKLTVSGREFSLTLIARRSRHFAGTRYLKRGVNEKGRVANDVETEQIVFEDNAGGIPSQISSVVQNRGSIPLFWSQESSWLNMKPDIILHKDQNYESTRLHFDNLVRRYGNPIIILNLIKTREKKPRETILRAEFAKAIDYINKSLPEDSRLRFLHWDLHKYSRKKATNVLALLGKVAAYALDLTGFFYCQVPPALRLQGSLTRPILVYSPREEASGRQPPTLKSFYGLFKDTTAIPTWMLKNRMPLTCFWGTFNLNQVSQLYGNWIQISITILEGEVIPLLMKIQGHLSKDHCQMATFCVKTAHLHPAVMLEKEHSQTRCCMEQFIKKEVQRVCPIPHQTFQLVKVKYLVPGARQ